MAEDTSTQRLEPQRATGLGRYLQGVQHVGVTVDDWAKSLEFYIDVLGGKPAIQGTGFYGDVLHNTLFQKEELDAWERDVSPRSLGAPELRTGQQEALDVVFISFGNIAVELIHFRDARLDPNAPNIFPKLPSGVGHGNACHISFHVKDDVDLNAFAKTLEEECQRRGIKNVVCNRVINVNSEEERRNAALKYYANKFWNDPEYFVEGYSDGEFGDFHGWSLFYCKGPNGEQLEFNQVTRRARECFDSARQQYNDANGTTYEASQSQPGPDVKR
jgi:catechol 2,3-dioxygenase-like lactoylglutathione lyase family enzyme